MCADRTCNAALQYLIVFNIRAAGVAAFGFVDLHPEARAHERLAELEDMKRFTGNNNAPLYNS